MQPSIKFTLEQKVLLGLFTVNMLAYQFIQDYLRPQIHNNNNVLSYLLGVAPNFFAAIALPAFFVFISSYIKNGGKYILYYATTFSTIGLLFWEITQIWLKKGVFDYNDIIWTILGSVTFIIIYKIIVLRHLDS